MKVIIAYYDKEKPFSIKEIAAARLPLVQNKERYVEMDFEMDIASQKQLPALEIFQNQSMLFATLGTKQQSKRVDAFYNMATKKIEVINKKRSLKETYWVSVYGSDVLKATDYILAIEKLTNWAKAAHKPLVIYSELIAKEVYYRYRSLTSKIVNQLLEEVNGVLVMYKPKMEIANYYKPSHKAFEFYIDKSIYLSCGYAEMIERVALCLKEGDQCDFRQVYRKKRQSESLYNELFYEMIPDTEKIYIPLKNSFSESGVEDVAYLKGLGLNIIQGSSSYSLIYDTKANINSKANEIREYIIPGYELPILERETLKATRVETPNSAYQVVTNNETYKGYGIYLGMVSESGVDYRATALRNSDGTTRIAGLWVQKEGNEGKFYTKDDINRALQSESPEEVVPIGSYSEENTMLLTIAGGKTEDYEGIASEAEFLFAQVNPASTNLQMIYGGMPNEKNITMGDLIVGIWKMQDYAKAQKKSVVFYVPQYTNVDSHDGEGTYHNLITEVCIKGGNAIVTSTGQEANKEHHQALYSGTKQNPIVNFKAREDGNNVIGLLTQVYLRDWQIELMGPNGDKVEMSKPGIYKLDGATVYSQGNQLNYPSGTREVMFRISNMNKGIWQLQVKFENNSPNRVDLWISGEESNPYVTLEPSTSDVTIGSIGNIRETACIAGYSLSDMITLASSGRGYTADGRVKPSFAAEGILQTMNSQGQRMEVRGPIVAGSVIWGASATVFEKWQTEISEVDLNGPVVRNIMLEYVAKPANVTFPNPNQGQGIFEQDTLNQILLTPFNA